MSPRFACHRHKLPPGSDSALRDWQRQMQARLPELQRTLRAEGITLEVVLIERAADGCSLVFVLECADYERAVAVFEQSMHPIDVFHRQFLDTHVVTSEALEVAYWVEDRGPAPALAHATTDG